MVRLDALQRPEVDTAFATVRLPVETAAQNGKSGPLRRFANETLPQQSFREYAKRLAGGRQTKAKPPPSAPCRAAGGAALKRDVLAQ